MRPFIKMPSRQAGRRFENLYKSQKMAWSGVILDYGHIKKSSEVWGSAEQKEICSASVWTTVWGTVGPQFSQMSERGKVNHSLQIPVSSHYLQGQWEWPSSDCISLHVRWGELHSRRLWVRGRIWWMRKGERTNIQCFILLCWKQNSSLGQELSSKNSTESSAWKH